MEMKRKKMKSGRSDKSDTCQYIRNKQIHIRASEDEFLEIERRAIQERKTIAKYLRDKALGNNKSKIYKNNEDMFLTISTLNQIKKIGTNINQIAHKVNAHSSKEQYLEELKGILHELKELALRGNR
ncbi:MobC family plasmid mobilization relaxosome protein [Comamonas sp. B-9]|uniref:MobC family plasmid mobilization relaxosome protein n=2 Tax=unclassified Comamonas TaxID=2638500 RepID=UPI000A00EEAE|nr:MobC family plasmid mobilization relaxosome protein [Comamonas sp. B-9]